MVEACSIRGRDFDITNLKGRDRFGYLSINGRIMLKWIIKK
jgi:hypothetical protein